MKKIKEKEKKRKGKEIIHFLQILVQTECKRLIIKQKEGIEKRRRKHKTKVKQRNARKKSMKIKNKQSKEKN